MGYAEGTKNCAPIADFLCRQQEADMCLSIHFFPNASNIQVLPSFCHIKQSAYSAKSPTKLHKTEQLGGRKVSKCPIRSIIYNSRQSAKFLKKVLLTITKHIAFH